MSRRPSRPATAVVTDSAASIPPVLAADLDVITVPLHLTVGDDDHLDGEVPLTDLLAAEHVTTAGVTPGEFVVAVDESGAESALIVTISSDMSATYKSAYLASTLASIPVVALDSGTAAGGEGLVVLRAAEVAATGAPFAAVEAAARHVIDRVDLVASVDSLDHLVRSGRVPAPAGWAGRRLGIQPLFRFHGGRVHPLRPSQSRAAALERMARRCLAGRTNGARLHVAALHALDDDAARQLLARITAEVEPATAFVAPFSAVMVAHTGPGLVGVAWYWED
jgi:DegV family protein with EDD domain